MRVLLKNRQKMKYAIYLGKSEDYEMNEDGTLKTITIDGVEVPVKAGTTSKKYAPVVEFRANITSTLNKLQAEAWGVSQSNIYSQINCEKGYLPLKIGCKVWRLSEVRLKADGSPDEASADYTIVGLMDEGLNEDLFLLQRNDVSEDE